MSSEPNREEGTNAIIALQKLAGITESAESAEAGWDSMSESEQETTIRIYREMFGEEKETQ